VRRITDDGDVWTVEAVGDYGGAMRRVVSSAKSATTSSSARRVITRSGSRRRDGERIGSAAWRVTDWRGSAQPS
jgi:hypothetical protein